MKIVSYMLAGIVVIFIVLVWAEYSNEYEWLLEDDNFDMADVWVVKTDYHTITSINIMIFAYSM